jgi:tRNA uridine 5-carbamoylmethylation protein Kti12
MGGYLSLFNTKRLILVRGLPNSGKTTLSNQLLDTYSQGKIFSTKDYFLNKNNKYNINHKKFSIAEQWNVLRVQNAMTESCNLIVVDSNLFRKYEAKAYVELSIKNGYIIEVLEASFNKNKNKFNKNKNKFNKYEDNSEFTVENILESNCPKNYKVSI